MWMVKDVGENIKRLRKAKRLTQSELGERVGLTKAAISSYENGSRLPSYSILIKLASLFRVTTDNLLGFSNQYTVDVSHLTEEQRNVLNEIALLYKVYNSTGGARAPNGNPPGGVRPMTADKGAL